ncbi:MAG: flavodoxin-dependent (E)-4-hydroxy-3-methylbut-2-enyl-diphosphate synthase [Pirellulaceae bacterium]
MACRVTIAGRGGTQRELPALSTPLSIPGSLIAFFQRDIARGDSPVQPTRSVRIGSISVGHQHPIAVQSMTATKTQDIDATVALVEQLRAAGADVVRIAVDSRKDAAALAEIRQQNDRQPFRRSARELSARGDRGPFVDKIRYNPGICTTTNARSRGKRR